MRTTTMPNAQTIQRKWYVIDAEGKTLGRLATQVASVLRGKLNTQYAPHVDCGDYVIVINAEKIELTGKKWNDKIYYQHSEYAGSLKETKAKDLMAKFPTRMVEKAVQGMLPHTTLGRDMYKKLYVYAGNEHPHIAQKPEKLEVL
ncbi:50S ribosomal protein L13 [Paracholeplasma morum]|uniref:50S ribosomal protein L13 n=1 Tax=Paracholeplasma morum TaxID=264637 RepID=UPI00195F124C|nr:50S ribosomal protein L13 [Paracholeplasma morum]